MVPWLALLQHHYLEPFEGRVSKVPKDDVVFLENDFIMKTKGWAWDSKGRSVLYGR
jgi:hypothetical protein